MVRIESITITLANGSALGLSPAAVSNMVDGETISTIMEGRPVRVALLSSDSLEITETIEPVLRMDSAIPGIAVELTEGRFPVLLAWSGEGLIGSSEITQGQADRFRAGESIELDHLGESYLLSIDGARKKVSTPAFRTAMSVVGDPGTHARGTDYPELSLELDNMDRLSVSEDGETVAYRDLDSAQAETYRQGGTLDLSYAGRPYRVSEAGILNNS